MNRDEIIKLALALDANIVCDLTEEDEGQVWYITTDDLERFAALVAAEKDKEIEKLRLLLSEAEASQDELRMMNW